MLPILLDPQKVKVAIIGVGPAFTRRVAQLASAGVSEPLVFEAGRDALPDAQALSGCGVVFIAGLQEDQARPLYEAAHEAGALVNTEDMRALCDFHMPAVVRRGDLLLTASTGGKSPGLARQLRKMLEQQFGPEWESILEDVATARQSWLDEGLSFSEVAKRTETYIEQNGWLA